MPAPLVFHFDFISPYGYFASLRVEELAARHDRTVDWRPMLLGVSVLKVMGLKPLLDTPLKGDYIRHDVRRHARRHGLQLGRDLEAPVGSPLPAARAFCWVRQHRPALQGPVAHALYHAYWAEGRDLSTPEALAGIALPQDLDPAELAGAAAGEEAAALLREMVAASLAAGVFGSPTLVVDGEPFWGADRLADVDEWLRCGGW
ncbi:2-hydroxychromene-2-carboxylate isomerase [Ramlibacter monticola]|uniref:2-hydroxychromene-2-carboxylate isomerase n=1 Tax=Ramlibacter monticola TaxID=1926872 RepID=A0A936YX84_9BURK|nr:2-hydroxychromene-2-carboxylate isomerase [Ramlibacter monticola]MBL0390282.1 2-hydroxychromene-2-carboxylate isomerase [Ramlibacter monticola]